MIRRFVLFVLWALSMAAADISGSWTFSVQIADITGSPKFRFEQKGEELTGSYSGQLGEAKVTGTVKANEVEFRFEAGGYPFIYKGTLEGDKAMKGKIDVAGQAEGSFTGKKD
ncbi:MAG: hypothetical protein FJW30_21375 [Acidobacteria bacterium]|nr:hypothetical protein [Acidobacteriota bacterium]